MSGNEEMSTSFFLVHVLIGLGKIYMNVLDQTTALFYRHAHAIAVCDAIMQRNILVHLICPADLTKQGYALVLLGCFRNSKGVKRVERVGLDILDYLVLVIVPFRMWCGMILCTTNGQVCI